MQLATSCNDKPWVCTVYFVHDENFNIFWVSSPKRRHSQELSANPNVSATIVIYDDPSGERVGFQIEGTASLVSDAVEIQKAARLYVDKYKSGKEYFLQLTADNPEQFIYKLKPNNIALFDQSQSPAIQTVKV